MKKFLLIFVLFAFVKANVWSQFPDLPDAAASYNPLSLPTGSYVIAMDNVNQSTGGFFNEKAYGLVVYLLNNNVRVRWVIQPGKAKDGIDFTVNSSRIKPTAAAAANLGYKAGPFVIFAADTGGVAAKVDAYNALSTTGTPVNVYKTNVDVTVDVRYDYLINGVIWKPKAAVLDDGGNGDIHAAYYVLAGITFGANGTLTLSGGKLTGSATAATNWVIQTSPDFVTNCFTFASEPHNTSAPANVLNGIADFVNGGGNFLAQCEAVRTYENAKRFQATNANLATTVFEKGAGGNTNATVGVVSAASTGAYPEPDLSFTQFEGGFDMNYAGSLRNWRLTSGSSFTGNAHNEINGSNGSLGNVPAAYGASVTKVPSIPVTQLGGMVFYLSQHLFSDATNDVEVINGFRMYMNAFLTPTNPQGSLLSSAVTHCASYPTPITVNCGSSAGPSSAYPLTFTLYEDIAPAGYGAEDIALGNVVTFTAPNTAQGGISTITAPALQNNQKNYLVAIRPASGCLQPKYLQSSCSTLPVSLLSFNAYRSGPMVNLKWKTSSEQNNRGFNIERLLGNGNWESIAFVPSQAPGGNSSADLSYTFVDPNNFKGITQYRLQQVDFDGRSKISDIRVVRGKDQKDKVIVFPNPSEGKVSVLFGDISGIARDVTLFDMSGRLVREWRGVTVNNIQIENLLSGMYSLRILVPATGNQTVEKIIVNKR